MRNIINHRDSYLPCYRRERTIGAMASSIAVSSSVKQLAVDAPFSCTATTSSVVSLLPDPYVCFLLRLTAVSWRSNIMYISALSRHLQTLAKSSLPQTITYRIPGSGDDSRAHFRLSLLYHTIDTRTIAMETVMNTLLGRQAFSQSDVPDLQGRVSVYNLDAISMLVTGFRALISHTRPLL